MNSICFCQCGMMSTCGASCPNEQMGCRFYEKSHTANRCMYFVFDKFCDSVQAQGFSRNPELAEEEELIANIDEFLEEIPAAVPDKRSCINCILYTCSYVIHENTMAQPRGGLTHDDLIHIAEKCKDYEDEQTMNEKISMSLRGITP